jgi:hypothetical protein
MSLEHLITDRTSQDVDRVKILAEKAWQDMTEEERAEWLTPMRGSYNYTDLNRVEEAVLYVAERLKEYGYLPVVPFTRSWSVSDKPNRSDFVRYFSNVDALRNAIAVWGNTPEVPNSAEGFDVNRANALEKILVDVDRIVNNMANSWFYSGDLYLSEV